MNQFEKFQQYVKTLSKTEQELEEVKGLESVAQESFADVPEVMKQYRKKVDDMEKEVTSFKNDIKKLQPKVVEEIVQTLKGKVIFNEEALLPAEMGEVSFTTLASEDAISLQVDVRDAKMIERSEMFSFLYEIANNFPSICQAIIKGLATAQIKQKLQ